MLLILKASTLHLQTEKGSWQAFDRDCSSVAAGDAIIKKVYLKAIIGRIGGVTVDENKGTDQIGCIDCTAIPIMKREGEVVVEQAK